MIKYMCEEGGVMEKWKRRAVELLGALSANSEKASVVPYYPQKTEIPPTEKKTILRISPEKVGVSSLRIINMLTELESDRRANIHSILVIRRGAVIAEASAPGYSVDIPHLSHSMSKTLTGMAVGLLVGDGLLSLDERLVDIFPEEKHRDERFAEMTVAHLLSMTSGATFGELGVVTETDWTGAFFESSLAFAPGERFAYNSMNSYILARIVCLRAGMSLTELVERRIFAPLGIKSYLMEIGPEGVEKGGFGVYLSAESWAKLGLMMLGGGVYGGRRILPKDWVADSVTTHAISPESSGDFNYGYHLWVHRERDEFLFNGMLGQNVWVCPSNDLVVVITAGNNELFQQSPALYTVRKHLAGELSDELRFGNSRALSAVERRFFESRRYARPLAEERGLLCLLGLKEKRPYSDSWNAALGKYRARANGCSVLPIFVRCMQNNLSSGIESLELLREGERLFLETVEGGERNRLEIGLYDHAEGIFELRGEKYLARAVGEATYDIDGKPMFRIEIVFPELPNTRIMELFGAGDEAMLLKLSERPNNRIAEPFLESIPVMNPKLAFAKQMLDRRFGNDFLKSKLARIFSPSLMLIRADAERADELIAYEEELEREETRSVRLLVSMLLRFMKGEVEEEIPDAPPEEEKRGFFSELMEKIRRMVNNLNSQ